MYCTKKIASDLVWVGANDRRLAMFEGVYSVPAGVSYNSYLLTDEKTVLFDTVDKAVSRTFFENLAHELDGRTLDYVIVHHMEPDHSATLSELLLAPPGNHGRLQRQDRRDDRAVFRQRRREEHASRQGGRRALRGRARTHVLSCPDDPLAGGHDDLRQERAHALHRGRLRRFRRAQRRDLRRRGGFRPRLSQGGAPVLYEHRRQIRACRCRISSRRSRVWTFRCSARCTASSGGAISDIFWKSTTFGAPIRRRTRA